MVRLRLEGSYDDGFTARLVDPRTGETVARAGPYANLMNAESAGHLLAHAMDLAVTADD
jgi:hypothetical protein